MSAKPAPQLAAAVHQAVHQALGLKTTCFQDIYHFTVGTALVDRRLASEPAYAPRDQSGNDAKVNP